MLEINKTTINLFIKIYHSALTNTSFTEVKEASIDELQKAYNLAHFHNLEVIFYYGLLNNNVKIPEGLAQTYKKNLYKAITQDAELEAICKAFTDQAIYHLPLKGSIIKKIYPHLEQRQMADLDILVDKQDLKKAGEVLKSLGYDVDSTGGNHDVFIKLPYMNIELHRRLFSLNSPYYEEFIDILEQSKSSSYTCMMSNEDFYLHMIAHSAKHFALGGTGLKIFGDLYLFLNHHQMNIEYLEEKLSKMNLIKYHQLLNRITKCIFEQLPFTEDDELILQYLVSSGTYGTDVNFINSASVNNGKKESKGKYLLRRIFPPYNEMKTIDEVLVKAPILLPFCWVKRIIRSLFHLKRHRNELKTYDAQTNEQVQRIIKIKEISGIN